MKKIFKYIGVFGLLLLIAFGTVVILNTRTITAPASGNSEQQAAVDYEQVSSDQIALGLQTYQLQFEQSNPIYPDQIYNLKVENGLLTDSRAEESDIFIWEMVRDLAITNRGLNRIESFEIFNDEEELTLASIEAQDLSGKSFLYSVNYVSLTDFEEFAKTLVHEHAHIDSLSDEKLTSKVENPIVEATCRTLYIDEGCAKSDNPLNQFYAQFWTESEVIATESLNDDQRFEYFDDRSDRYVNDYAASNPVEDFAESFMSYVFEDDPTSSNGPLEIKDQKKLFFQNYEEYRQYRSRVRALMASWGG